ncbi:MAG: ABC transporter permease [Propionibacteriaceae bacterium]|jgi:ABC-type transport system involved in multi-copper enzyme maturation permease subunit|nr:ABC transporter permease [Propionibacteriaceae bacterium]
MIAAIRSEYRKFFSTRLWWILMLVMFAYILLFSGGVAGIFSWLETSDPETFQGTAESMRPMAYGFAPSLGYVFPAIVGALAWTNEYRHRTIVPTFLGEPRRGVVSIAKAVAGVPMGFVIGLVGTIAAVGGGAVGFAIFGFPTQLGDVETWKNAGLSVLALTIWAILGVGLGMLITSQIGVIITLLVWTQLLEGIVMLVCIAFEATRGVPKYLPGQLGAAIVGGSETAMLDPTGGLGAGDTLVWWQAALLLAGYGVVFGIVGYFVRIRRDVN